MAKETWYDPRTWTRKSVQNVAAELTGINDIRRGAAELGKGNIAGGLGRIALGVVGAAPGAGWAVKGASAASKLAKGSKFVTAATKAKPTQALARPVQAVTRTKPVQVVTKPVKTAASKTTSGVKAAGKKATTPLVKATSKPGKLVASFTTPYTISRYLSSMTIPNTAQAAPNRPNIFDAAQRSWDQTQLAASLMGTNVPKTGGGTPGTGGGTSGGRGPGTGGTGPGAEPGGPMYEGETLLPDTPQPDQPGLGGGIEVGGGTEGYGTEDIATGGGEDLYGGPGQMMIGTPGDVAKAQAQYGAGLAAIAADAKIRDAALREMFAQGMMGVRGTAADILGGRSAAIRGQGTTGVRREYQIGKAQAAQDRMREESALARTYGSEVAAGYQKAAQDVMDLAQRRSETAARIRSLG